MLKRAIVNETNDVRISASPNGKYNHYHLCPSHVYMFYYLPLLLQVDSDILIGFSRAEDFINILNELIIHILRKVGFFLKINKLFGVFSAVFGFG